MLEEALLGFKVMPLLEWVAVLFGIAYVLLAAKESLWTWVFAFFGTLIYTYLFWQGSLLSSTLLNFYYMVMALVGFWLWRNGKQKKGLTVSSFGIQKSVAVFVVATLFSMAVGSLFEEYFSAKFAHLDAFVFTLSLVATYMMVNKVLENWLFWVVVDAAGMVLYYKSGYFPTVVLFGLYVVLAVYGYLSWQKELRVREA